MYTAEIIINLKIFDAKNMEDAIKRANDACSRLRTQHMVQSAAVINIYEGLEAEKERKQDEKSAS